jgi:hypothetical protein
VPTCATATDLAGLEFWAHAGIDLHLVMHGSCVAPVERVAGVGSARRVRPLVAPAFFEPCSRERARRELLLPPNKPMVVVSGGGWGVGDLEGAVRACLQLPTALVVCLTARNEPLRARLSEAFGDETRVWILGFSDRMSELLAAADALVHSTGGVTCLEALVHGCPIVAYGAPPGHAPLTARVMASLGLLQSADSPPQLVAALGRALAQPAPERPRLVPAPSAASLVLTAEARLRRAPSWRARLLRPTAAAAPIVALGGWLFLSDDAYPLVARTLGLEPISSIATERPEVGLVIRAPAPIVPDLVRVLRRGEAHASFGYAVAPNRRALRALTGAGDEPLPELSRGKLTRWLDTKDELKRDAHALGLPNRHFYLAPPSGLTTSQYLLARDIGAAPIRGSARIGPDSRGARAFSRGDIIVLTLGSQPGSAAKALDQLLAGLARQGLTPVSFGELVASRRQRPQAAWVTLT